MEIGRIQVDAKHGKILANSLSLFKLFRDLLKLIRISILQRYGKIPNHEELKATGGICPICHDNLSEPTKLHCKHIFCEECVTMWFDREKTCPMCRAQVSYFPLKTAPLFFPDEMGPSTAAKKAPGWFLDDTFCRESM